METTILGYIGIIGYILGLHRGNGREHGKYNLGFRVPALWHGFIGIEPKHALRGVAVTL